MGKILFRLMTLIGVVVALFALVGSLLPRDYQFAATAEISAEPRVVFEMMNHLPSWQQWSNFSKDRIAGLEIEYGEIKTGVGAVQKWTDVRGSGKMWITNSLPNRLIEYDLYFGDFPTMKSRIELEQIANGRTQVTWTSSGKLPAGPFYGFTGLLFPGQMQYEYAQNLQRIEDSLPANGP